jgi:hypothetical protein
VLKRRIESVRYWRKLRDRGRHQLRRDQRIRGQFRIGWRLKWRDHGDHGRFESWWDDGERRCR